MKKHTKTSYKTGGKRKQGAICIRVHKAQAEVIVAACDAELVGTTLSDGDIELHVSKAFYEDVVGAEDILMQHLKMATIANLVGHRAVECGIEAGFIDRKNVLMIGDIPHAQFAVM